MADILYGNVNPSGKLSVSYPAEELHEPICYNYSVEMDKRVAYPFGFGLSYTTFEYSNLIMDSKFQTSEPEINLSFDVTNTGKYEGDEVTQVYLSPIHMQLPAKIKPLQLIGFKRVSLKPGETKKVEFTLSAEQFGFYNKGRWSVNGGKYIVKIGASSTDICLQKDVNLGGDQRTVLLRKKYFAE